MHLLATGGMLWFAMKGRGEAGEAPNIKGAILVLLLWVIPLLGPPGLTLAACAEPLLMIGFLLLVLREAPAARHPGWRLGAFA